MSVIGQPCPEQAFLPSVVAATRQVGQDAPNGRQIKNNG